MRRPQEYDMNSGNPLAPYSPPVYNVPTGPYSAPSHGTAIPPPARTVPTLMGLLNALKRRWVLASFLGLLVALAAAAALWISSPTGKHQVKAVVEIMPLRAGVNSGQGTYDENFDNFKKNQEAIVTTRMIIKRVVANPDVANFAMIANSDDPVKVIQDLIVLRWPTPDLMSVGMNGDNPDQLKVILESLIKEYVSESSSGLQQDRKKKLDDLKLLKEELRKRIESEEASLDTQSQNGVPTEVSQIGPLMTLLTTRVGALHAEISVLENKINDYRSRIRASSDAIEGVRNKPLSDELLDTELSKDLNYRAILSDLSLERKAYEEAKLRIKDPNHPSLKRYEENIKKLQATSVESKTEKRVDIEKRYRSETVAAEEKESTIAKRELVIAEESIKIKKIALIEEQERLTIVTKHGAKAARTAEDLKPLKEQQANITKQILELTLFSKNTEGRVKVREDPAIVMNYNVKQKFMLSAATGVIAFFGVLTLVAFLEWRNRRVDSVDQVVNELGLRIIGTIPAFPSRASLKAGEADQNQNWRFILNESVNSTRTMLLHTAKTQSMQVIMVTSAMQGEGKTSLSSQLATSMATAGLRTLILDCDLRNPSMHRLFDVPLTPGCSEILLSEVDVSDAVQPTTVPNLWLIAAGQCSNRVVAALAQGHPLETLFNRLRGQFDFIVVDSCPVLPVADALLIGQHVDGVLISVLQDISQLPKVLNASERLSQLNIPLLGAVVNGVKTDIHAYGYNYVKQLPA